MIQRQLYDVFVRFEEQSADLYFDLSSKFAREPELSWFWVEMGIREKQHAGVLLYCQENGLFGTPLPGCDDIRVLGGLFKDLTRTVGEPGVTIDRAFEVAFALESSEIHPIYTNLTRNIDGPQYVTRKESELSPEKQFEQLRSAATRFRVSPSIQKKFATLAQARYETQFVPRPGTNLPFTGSPRIQ